MPRTNLIPNEKYYWTPTLASQTAPKVAELTTTGKLLSPAIKRGGVDGFTYSAGTEDAGDIDTRWPVKVGGLYDVPDMAITFLENTTPASAEATILALFAVEASGFVVISRNGLAILSTKVEVWPVTVTSVSPANRAVNEAAATKVSFSFAAPPTVNAVVSA